MKELAHVRSYLGSHPREGSSLALPGNVPLAGGAAAISGADAAVRALAEVTGVSEAFARSLLTGILEEPEKRGLFVLTSPVDGTSMMVTVARDVRGYDRVAVFRRKRAPNELEVRFVRRILFRDDETTLEMGWNDEGEHGSRRRLLVRPTDGRAERLRAEVEALG